MYHVRHDVALAQSGKMLDFDDGKLTSVNEQNGYRVWYDEFTLKLGDSLRNEIDKGLVLCDYGAVILSPSFFSKEWPQFELDALFALEARDRRKRILPIWHHLTVDEVVSFSPMLAG